MEDWDDPQAHKMPYRRRTCCDACHSSASEALKARLNLTIVYVVAKPAADWAGERGFINADTFRRHLPPPYADHEYFICGPNVMMDAIEKALGEMNVPMSKYHSERYSFV